PERTALPGFTINPDPAPMQLKNPLGQSEPEPGALDLTGGPGALLERVEDALAVLGRHAHSRVGDQHDEVLTTYGGADVHSSALRSELHRVGQQIQHDLPEAQAIGVKQANLGIDVKAEEDSLLERSLTYHREAILQRFLDDEF